MINIFIFRTDIIIEHTSVFIHNMVEVLSQNPKIFPNKILLSNVGVQNKIFSCCNCYLLYIEAHCPNSDFIC